MKQEYDFVAIGDVVTDAFIRLEDPSAHIDINHDVREICMRFADKIPYSEVYVIPGVGNSPNAAVSAARLGLSSASVSNVGDDAYGRECIDVLKKEKVSTDFIKSHQGEKTNYHYVLWYENDRTILVKHHEYDYSLPNIGNPKWIYLSSLGQNSLQFHHAIKEYLTKHKSIKLAFQPGTFQIKLGKEKLADLYKLSEIFFCNKEEAQRILVTKEEDIKKLLKSMHDLGPKIIVITDGPKGAYTFNGESSWFMRSYPDPKPPLERTGAGDSFSSAFTVALGLGLDIPKALRLAPINSMSVVQYVGAREGLLTMPQLEKYLSEAPPDYHPKRL